jgi:predicted CoA-substrate-specific enzyme activase
MSSASSKSLGVCIGASTVSAVWIKNEQGKIKIDKTQNTPHYGHPKSVVTEIFKSNKTERISVTGRKLRTLLNLTSISEPEAIEQAFEFLNYPSDIIISIGGENFIVYELDVKGKITKPITGNKCASGTGEFFLQQIKRMKLEQEEAVSLALAGKPYKISGRCSVFCKSDCTHALNKGIAKADVVAGLSKMMAQKVFELSAKSDHKNILMIGGVSQNKALINYLREHFDNLTVPQEAPYFEALGSALYALKNNVLKLDNDDLFKQKQSSFTFHPQLVDFEHKVIFKSVPFGNAEKNDQLILGLDVGSTTTKAVLVREKDNTIVASEYLRTNGDPVAASLECYQSLDKRINVPVQINGLGVTGSGRYIAGLHAQTKGIINEIIAHAAATVYFDKDVDTIFEIGGQDAKYTHITAGVPSDYAMNEACSAGTGSFLEEAAKESLNIDFRDIGDIALKAKRAPNFNDQCSAFISSDIKNALHEGLSKEDIVAGLVYSICLNYTNRVKGNRPIGRKVFMQGGVCYNKAVPMAMAALTGKEIIVPPEPGLMGAFGVALEIKERLKLKLNLIEKQNFDLKKLIKNRVEYGKNFICAGGVEKCDLKCNIALISINGKKYPFGGSCNKYYNQQNKTTAAVKKNNLIRLRQELVFDKYLHPLNLADDAPTVGIPKSFLTNTLYPLFYNFFMQAGFKVVLGDVPKTAGIKMQQAAFCYPVELAHGFIQDLIDKKPDIIFIPHIEETFNKNTEFRDRTCVLLQSESYYLQTAFKNKLNGTKIISPLLNFAQGHHSAKDAFVAMYRDLNISRAEAAASFDFANGELQAMFTEFKQIGEQVISELEQDREKFAIVLMGRAYSAFAGEANLGIPQKFASRHITIIPHDFIVSDFYKSMEHMYWGVGRQLLRTARFVKQHPQLHAAWITNFSCGPDAFLLGYFRTIMGQKPSLTLELDSHSADAGLNTRIEAFLDIVKSYRQIDRKGFMKHSTNGYIPLRVKDGTTIVDSSGDEVSIFDPSIKFIVPNMGRLVSEGIAATFRNSGINTQVLPLYDQDTLKRGRGSATCKECLPLLLTSGSMIDYYVNKKEPDERTLFFMTQSDGPCRMGQYHVFLRELIKKRKYENIGVYTMSDEDNFDGFDENFNKRSWESLVVGDVMQNIYHAIDAIALDKKHARHVFEIEWKKIVNALEFSDQKELFKQLEKTSKVLVRLKKKHSYDDVPKVALIGEIFVRNDEFSRLDIIKKLSARNIIVKVAPVTEYMHYSNFLIERGQTTEPLTLKEKFGFRIRKAFQEKIERKVRMILSESGFCDHEVTDVVKIVDRAKGLINPALAGEAILTVGSALNDIIDTVSGVISLGPFGCLPSRVAESILNVEMNIQGKMNAEGKKLSQRNGDIDELPFLAIETDGNPFPQIIQSRLEIFLLQTERLHKKLQTADLQTKMKYRSSFNVLISKFNNRKTTKYSLGLNLETQDSTA